MSRTARSVAVLLVASLISMGCTTVSAQRAQKLGAGITLVVVPVQTGLLLADDPSAALIVVTGIAGLLGTLTWAVGTVGEPRRAYMQGGSAPTPSQPSQHSNSTITGAMPPADRPLPRESGAVRGFLRWLEAQGEATRGYGCYEGLGSQYACYTADKVFRCEELMGDAPWCERVVGR